MKTDIISKFIDRLSDRLVKSWLTTLVGVIIIVGSLVSHFVLQTEWLETLIGIAVGVAFLPMKDPEKGASIFILLLAFTLSSCVTYNRCQSKFGEVSTQTKVIEDTIKVPISVKPDPIYYTLSWRLDSLLWAKPGTKSTFRDPSGQITITASKDSTNENISLDVLCDPDTVYQDKLVPIRVEVPCETTSFSPKPRFLNRVWDGYKTFAAIGFAVLLILNLRR